MNSESLRQSYEGFDRFAEMALETQLKDYYNPMESVDAYSARLKNQLKKQLGGYQDRLTRGYQVLLDEISTHEPKA